MSKLLVIYFIVIGFTLVTSVEFDRIKSDARKFTKKLIDELDRKMMEVEEAFNFNSTTLQKIDRGIVTFEQSAQIHNLYGIKDNAYPRFLSAYFKNSIISPYFLDLMKDKLLDITLEENSDWKSFKFLYTRNEDNVCVYTCILAQHDVDSKKINWIYTEILTTVEINDVFLLTTTEIRKGVKKETQNIVSLPSKIERNEVNLLIDFFDIIAYKTFGRYFGIENSVSIDDFNGFGRDDHSFLS